MELPQFNTKVIQSDPYRSVVLHSGALILAECSGSQKQNVANEIKMRCNHHQELFDALESLTNMAASFPTELHAQHPDVVRAKAILELINQEEVSA